MPEMNPAAPARNVLSSDVEIKGTITFENDMIFDGRLDGEITSTGVLTIGANAVVNGEIRTRSVIVRGTVEGNITVDDRCELRGNAKVIGDLKASRLVMEENVTLIGKSEVTPDRSGKEPSLIRPLEFVKQAVRAAR